MAKRPATPSKPESSRALDIQAYLTRYVPYWGHPGWLESARWRQFVRNQPIAIICRDTLIMNLLSMDWSLRPSDPEDDSEETKKDVEWYTDMLLGLEDDFDNYVELICQDILDLPFGAASEVFRQPDSEDGKVIWVEHIDAATLYPTMDDNWPVIQRVPDLPGRQVTFPKHAIERIYLSPRPEIKRKGWGMAPPEKIYLAMEMLYRGDRYYANMLLDTPEAGILDLLDFDESSVDEWLRSFRELFQGIDGMKVPVLYDHEKPAQWIPLNRPPIDMLYDKTTIKYAQITAAGYGMRLSDIGMSELPGEKTLAGVIRGERQTRRSGFALLRSKVENHFDALTPKNINFVWEDKDEEVMVARGRALQTVGAALTQLLSGQQPLLSQEEARQELAASGLLEIEIDPKEIPEAPQQPGGQPFPFGMPKLGQNEGPMAGGGKSQMPMMPGGGQAGGGKLPSQGGRGTGFMARMLGGLVGRDKLDEEEVEGALAPEMEDREADTPERLIARMDMIVKPGLMMIPERAEDIRLRRLIRAATKAMFPSVERVFVALSDSQLENYWLPNMNLVEFDMESDLDGMVIRQSQEEIREILERHLEDDPWWRVASAWERAEIIEIYRQAMQHGLEQQAINILRALYEEGLASSPYFGPNISFNLVNRRALSFIERQAADFVANVDNGTKYFIKRIISSGVRQGLTNPRIAQAIREGEVADAILSDEGFNQQVINEIMKGMIEMTERRANSITMFEIKKAENRGHYEQIKRSGLKTKAWVHLGPRGITPAGNPHPCPVCTENEELGYVPEDHIYRSVFKKGGDDDKGGILHPPAHPNVCHCRIVFDEKELFKTVGEGKFAPWLGN